jgi:hypothetical protein
MIRRSHREPGSSNENSPARAVFITTDRLWKESIYLLIFWPLVEAIGRNSNLAHLSNKWSDLRKRIAESLPCPPQLYQDKPKTRSKRFLTSQDIADIVARYQAGETTQQVGTRYGISKTRVATVLREQVVTIRRQGLTDERAREAAKFYVSGRSLAWIGARFGVSNTTITAELRKQGVQLRPRPGFG